MRDIVIIKIPTALLSLGLSLWKGWNSCSTRIRISHVTCLDNEIWTAVMCRFQAKVLRVSHGSTFSFFLHYKNGNILDKSSSFSLDPIVKRMDLLPNCTQYYHKVREKWIFVILSHWNFLLFCLLLQHDLASLIDTNKYLILINYLKGKWHFQQCLRV